MNSLALPLLKLATKAYEYCPRILPDIHADANEETIPKGPLKIGPAVPNEGPKLADVSKKNLFNCARESFDTGFTVPSKNDKDSAPLSESTYTYAATPSKTTLFKFANLNQGEKGVASTGSCSLCDNTLAANTTSVAKKSLFNLAREKFAEGIPFRSNGSMGQIFQRPLPFSNLPTLSSIAPNNTPIPLASDSSTTVKAPSTTDILDGFSGKKLSWEKHAQLFPKHRFGAVSEFFAKFTAPPPLPNTPPFRPNPFFEGYGSMGQKFSLPNTPDTATQTNFSAKDWLDSELNESQYMYATIPSKHTLFKFANPNQGEKGVASTGPCSLCDNTLAAHTTSVAKKSFFNLAREQWAKSIPFLTNNSLAQEFDLPNTPNAAPQTNVTVAETSPQMTSSISSHNAGATPPPSTNALPEGPNNVAAPSSPAPETNKSWDNNFARPIKWALKLITDTGKSIRKIGLLSTQTPSNNSSASEPSLATTNPRDEIDDCWGNPGQTSAWTDSEVDHIPPKNWFYTNFVQYDAENAIVWESGQPLHLAKTSSSSSPPQATDNRGWVQWTAEGLGRMGTSAFKWTTGTVFDFNMGICKGAVRAAVPGLTDAYDTVSRGMEKIPPGLRIPAVAFAALALIGAYSYFRRSKETEPTDNDDQGNFPLTRGGQAPSMIEYQMINQLAQLQAQLAQIQKASQLDGAKKQSAPETKPQPAVIINKNRYYNSPPPEAVPEKPAKAPSKKAKPGETSVSLDVDYYNADGKEDTAASKNNQRHLTNNQEALHV